MYLFFCFPLLSFLCFCDYIAILDAFLIEFSYLYLIIICLSSTYYILDIVLDIMHLLPLILINYKR